MKVLNKMLLNWIYDALLLRRIYKCYFYCKIFHTVSHFTGHISKAAINVISGNFLEVLKIISIVFAFIIVPQYLDI